MPTVIFKTSQPPKEFVTYVSTIPRIGEYVVLKSNEMSLREHVVKDICHIVDTDAKTQHIFIYLSESSKPQL